MVVARPDAMIPTQSRVFLSHSSNETTEVEALRVALDRRGIACFLDVLELRAGDDLAATLKEQVQEARAFVVVLSPAAVSSRWVRQEIQWALAAEDLATETGGRYRFLPVFTGGITHGFLDWLGRSDVLGMDANGRPLANVASEIAQALGELPVDARPRPTAAPLPPIAELTLDFHDLTYEVQDEKQRVRGRVRVEYQPPSGPRGAAGTRLREPARSSRAGRASLVPRDVARMVIRQPAAEARDGGREVTAKVGARALRRGPRGSARPRRGFRTWDW